MADRRGIVEFPCDVERLPNGHTLICDAGTRPGRQRNRRGDARRPIVWRYGDGLRFAHSAKRLPNATPLLPNHEQSRDRVTGDGGVDFTSESWAAARAHSPTARARIPEQGHAAPRRSLLITDRNHDRPCR